MRAVAHVRAVYAMAAAAGSRGLDPLLQRAMSLRCAGQLTPPPKVSTPLEIGKESARQPQRYGIPLKRVRPRFARFQPSRSRDGLRPPIRQLRLLRHPHQFRDGTDGKNYFPGPRAGRADACVPGRFPGLIASMRCCATGSHSSMWWRTLSSAPARRTASNAGHPMPPRSMPPCPRGSRIRTWWKCWKRSRPTCRW